MSTLTQDPTQSYTSTANYAQYGPKLKTALPGPNAKKIVAADDRLISPSYTRSYPLVAKAAAAYALKTSTATSFSTSPPASPSLRPATVILKSSPPFRSRPPN